MDDLPRQIDTHPPLECGKCRHTDQIEIKDDEIHCHFCGNFAIIGMKSRWPFRNIGLSKVVNQGNHVGKSPVEGTKKEGKMGTYGKTCAIPNCEKKSWLKGLCHKHYIEKFGEYVPVKRGTGVVVPKKEPRVKLKPEAIQKAVEEGRISQEKGARLMHETTVQVMEQGENRKDPAPLPGLRIIIPDKLLEKLAIVAEREYRTVNQQAAYFVTKGLERE